MSDTPPPPPPSAGEPSAAFTPDEVIAGIVLPEYVEDSIDGFRVVCRRDPDRGGDHRERGHAADRLRNAIRRAIYDAERVALAPAQPAAREAGA